MSLTVVRQVNSLAVSQARSSLTVGAPGPQGPAGEDGAAGVSSVNGETGVVTLNAADVGAATTAYVDSGDATVASAASAALVLGLSGKANTSHTHAQSDVTNLVSDLAGKAASSHTHAQSDVTNLVSDLAGKAASSHTHAASDIASGTVATARLGSGTADATTYLTGAQTYVRQLTTIPFHSDGSGPIVLTNQANSTQFLANSDSNIAKLDLSRFTQVKLTARVTVGSASANSPKIALKYSTSYTTTAASYSDIGTSAVEVSLTTATLVDTGWIDLATSAKAEVFVAIIQTGGDGAADPRVGLTHAHFR